MVFRGLHLVPRGKYFNLYCLWPSFLNIHMDSIMCAEPVMFRVTPGSTLRNNSWWSMGSYLGYQGLNLGHPHVRQTPYLLYILSTAQSCILLHFYLKFFKHFFSAPIFFLRIPILHMLCWLRLPHCSLILF